jgi:hypothetical protein
MTWKQGIVTAGLIAALATIGPILAADEAQPTEPKPVPQEPKQEPKEEPKTAPPAEAKQESKPGFWGDHFALYLEAGGGTGSARSVESSIQTSATAWAISNTDLDDVVNGRFGVGWKLPADHGSFLIAFHAYSENSYTFESTAFKKAVQSASSPPSVSEGYQWWTVDIDGGNLTSELLPPVWVDIARLEPHCPIEDPLAAPGVCFNGAIDPGEVNQSSTPTAVFTTEVPDNTQNRLQHVDGLYQRTFGGKVWSGNWSAGLRYLLYEGNIPATAWLHPAPAMASQGFTNGAGLRLLVVNQNSSGLGPTGTLGFSYNTWKRRLAFYAQATFAFLIENLESDTGDFITIVRSGNTEFIAPARLQRSLSKTAWNFGGELGARFKIVEGFGVELGWNRTAYQDVVLLPFSISIPTTQQQIPQGTVGLFATHDLTIDALHVGLTFQF